MDSEQQNKCSIRPQIPELYFCADMRGYGWCFRKGNFINIGLGRLDKHSLGAHITAFIEFLRRTKKITFDLPSKTLRPRLPAIRQEQSQNHRRRNPADRRRSGYGLFSKRRRNQARHRIRPPSRQSHHRSTQRIPPRKLERYRALLTNRFGPLTRRLVSPIGRRLSPRLMSSLGRALLATKWFSRHIVLNKWSLRPTEPVFQ